ncbi:MAG: hypothetical protein LBO09_02880 [Candidatus Peribacteria bacterium]|jgi:endonuclease-3|nr:hypothetical protein [Candidatus Peribacteria bacterium]
MNKRTPKNYTFLFDYISSLFPKLDTELNYQTPFQLLMAVMMSAQTTDKQVNKITDQLFLTIKTPYDIITLGQENLEKAISSVNYYKAKAKHIYATAALLVEQATAAFPPAKGEGGEAGRGSANTTYLIPSAEADLIKLPGV